MNWTPYQVSEQEYQALIDFNHPITVNGSQLQSNVGVEIYTDTGKRFNAIYDGKLKAIRRMNSDNPVFRHMPNRDILLYNDHLKNPDVNTIIVDGFFGTGKTSTLSSHLVNGLAKAVQHEKDGIPCAYLSKPHVSLGNGYGFLPGGILEKTDLEFQSYYQYFSRYGGPGFADFLMKRGIDEKGKFAKQKEFDEEEGIPEPMLHVLTFEYLRGLDINEGWIVLDESQNTTAGEMTSFISRVGDDAKLVIMGDTTVTQIDRKGNTPLNNGLTFAKETYMGKRYSGYVELQTINHILRGERVKDLFRKLKGV